MLAPEQTRKRLTLQSFELRIVLLFEYFVIKSIGFLFALPEDILKSESKGIAKGFSRQAQKKRLGFSTFNIELINRGKLGPLFYLS